MKPKTVKPTNDTGLMLEQLRRYIAPQLGPWTDAEDFHEAFGWVEPELTKTRNQLRDDGLLKIRRKNGRLQYRINLARLRGRVEEIIERGDGR